MEKQQDAIALVFMAQFQKERLKEMQNLVNVTNDEAYKHFCRTQNNPELIAKIAELEKKYRQLEEEYNRHLLRQAFKDKPMQAEDLMRVLDLWINQDTVTEYNAKVQELDYYRTVNEDLMKKNRELNMRIETKRKTMLLQPQKIKR